MRKKIMALGLAVVMVSATACSGISALTGNKYVTLGDYTDLSVDYSVEQTEITDEDVQAQLETNISKYSYEAKKSYKAKNGDTVNIDYEGVKDGEAFEGGTAEGFDLVLGSKSFIDGFEDGLIGSKKGQKLDLNLTFPKSYPQNEELAGQDVVFHVTVNYVKITPTMDDLDDTFVKEKIKTYTTAEGTEETVTTVDQYTQLVRADLETNLEKTIAKAKREAAWKQVVANCKIKSYPEDQVDKLVQDMNDWYTEYAGYYGYEKLEDFVEASGSTLEEYEENVESSAKEEVASRLITEAIAKKEKLELTDEDYKTGLEKYATEYGYESASDMEEKVGEDEVRVELQREKVQDWIVENCTLNLTESTSADTATASPAE